MPFLAKRKLKRSFVIASWLWLDKASSDSAGEILSGYHLRLSPLCNRPHLMVQRRLLVYLVAGKLASKEIIISQYGF